MLLDKLSAEYEILKKTVFMESKGQGYESQKAVAWVIYNRLRRNPVQWGHSIIDVCLLKDQFECWKNNVARIIEMENAIRTHRREFNKLDNWLPSAFDGVDPTARISGADHYYYHKKEKLTQDYKHKMRIGDIVFYKD